MKLRRCLYLLLSGALFLLPSCGETGTSNTDSATSSSPTSLDTTSSSEEASYRYSKEVDTNLQYLFGDLWEQVPIYEGNYYISDLGKIKNGDTEQEVCEVDSYLGAEDDMTNAMKNYDIVLKSQGYEIYSGTEEGYEYAINKVDYGHYIALIYTADTTEKIFSLVTYPINLDTEFPNDWLKENLNGNTLPEPEAQYYAHSIDTSAGFAVCSVSCYGANMNASYPDTYAGLLEKEGYVLLKNDEDESNVFYSGQNETLGITVGFGYDSSADMFYILAYYTATSSDTNSL